MVMYLSFFERSFVIHDIADRKIRPKKRECKAG